MAKVATPKKSSKVLVSGKAMVDEFILTSTHPLKEVMTEVRAILLSTNKEMTEHIKWNAPSFCFGGDDRITFNLHKPDILLLVFHCGAKAKTVKQKTKLIDDSTGLLQWITPDRATVTLASMSDVKASKAALKKVATEWIKAAA